jgi:hypothetical protein
VTTVATSETLSAAPIAPAAPAGHARHEAPAARGAAPAKDGAPAQPAAPETPAPSASSAPIGFKLRYDQDTRRLILEARDPVSGFVIYQIPPKYVIKQFSARVGAVERARGGRVDSAV